MAGFLSNKQQGQRALLSAPFIFYPKTKTASSIKQGDPSVSRLTSGIHIEILVWGSISANIDLGMIRKRAQAPFWKLFSISAPSSFILNPIEEPKEALNPALHDPCGSFLIHDIRWFYDFCMVHVFHFPYWNRVECFTVSFCSEIISVLGT